MNDIWNPWHGCKKYSEGCENCYMYYLDSQRDKDGSDIYKVKTNFNLPLKKSRNGEYKIPSGAVLRVCMTSDFFLTEADEWRKEVWEMIKLRPDITFWLQTKRAERVLDNLPSWWGDGLDQYLSTGKFEIVLVDGENYEGNRPLYFDWVKKIYDECVKYNIKFDFCGTGNVFIKDGKTYNIPKAYQRVMALKSELQNPLIYKEKDIKIQPRCKTCKRRFSCNGCKWCRKCNWK